MSRLVKFPVTMDKLPKGLAKHRADIKSVIDRRDTGDGLTVTMKSGHKYSGKNIVEVTYLVNRGPYYTPLAVKRARDAQYMAEWADSGEWCDWCQAAEDDGCCCGSPNEY